MEKTYPPLIDLWDVKTFDGELVGALAEQSDLIGNYVKNDNSIFLAHDLRRSPVPSLVRPENPYAGAFCAWQEEIGLLMQSRLIRAWHYTRLTEEEVDYLR